MRTQQKPVTYSIKCAKSARVQFLKEKLEEMSGVSKRKISMIDVEDHYIHGFIPDARSVATFRTNATAFAYVHHSSNADRPLLEVAERVAHRLLVCIHIDSRPLVMWTPSKRCEYKSSTEGSTRHSSTLPRPLIVRTHETFVVSIAHTCAIGLLAHCLSLSLTRIWLQRR
jgi:hypothetical protein